MHRSRGRVAPPTLSRPAPGGARPNTKPGLSGRNDARTGVPLGMPRGAMCVQRLDDSLNSAIHITYRISLRSSSMPEPRDPLLKVLFIRSLDRSPTARNAVLAVLGRALAGRSRRRANPAARRSNRWVDIGREGGSEDRPLLCNDPSAGSPTEQLRIL